MFGGSVTARPNPNAGGNHRKSLVENLDASLKRMGTGYTDILYVHMWEYRTPVQEVMRALDDVVRSGTHEQGTEESKRARVRCVCVCVCCMSANIVTNFDLLVS